MKNSLLRECLVQPKLPNPGVTPTPKRGASKPKQWLKESLGRDSITTNEKYSQYSPADGYESCHYMEFPKTNRNFNLILLERIAIT